MIKLIKIWEYQDGRLRLAQPDLEFKVLVHAEHVEACVVGVGFPNPGRLRQAQPDLELDDLLLRMTSHILIKSLGHSEPVEECALGY